MYNNLNQKLSELQSGNYLMKVKSISDRRPNEYYSKEYFVTVKYQVTDLNNPKRKFGVIVSGMGSKPIELNVDRELLPTNYFVWDNFDEVLFERLSNRDMRDKLITEERMKQFERDVLHWINYDYVVINDSIETCYLKIKNLIDAEINDGSKDYDAEYIRNHIEKLTS